MGNAEKDVKKISLLSTVQSDFDKYTRPHALQRDFATRHQHPDAWVNQFLWNAKASIGDTECWPSFLMQFKIERPIWWVTVKIRLVSDGPQSPPDGGVFTYRFSKGALYFKYARSVMTLESHGQSGTLSHNTVNRTLWHDATLTSLQGHLLFTMNLWATADTKTPTIILQQQMCRLYYCLRTSGRYISYWIIHTSTEITSVTLCMSFTQQAIKQHSDTANTIVYVHTGLTTWYTSISKTTHCKRGNFGQRNFSTWQSMRRLELQGQ